GTRIFAAMCLALFTTSFVHFGAGHASQAWSSELLVHHAGIPLALFVLLQDYRFVLLDAFIRFLANAFLAAALTALVTVAAFRWVGLCGVAEYPSRQAVLLRVVPLSLVLFAGLKNRLQPWFTFAVFRRGGVPPFPRRIKDPPVFTNAEQYLDWAAAVIAGAV